MHTRPTPHLLANEVNQKATTMGVELIDTDCGLFC